jgi:hypothetical protein
MMPKLQMLQLQEATKAMTRNSEPPKETAAVMLPPHKLPVMTRVPLQVLAMQSLVELHIRRNAIEEFPDAIGKMRQLRLVDAGENALQVRRRVVRP